LSVALTAINHHRHVLCKVGNNQSHIWLVLCHLGDKLWYVLSGEARNTNLIIWFDPTVAWTHDLLLSRRAR
jgi:hypothetical protein